jgi:hypothetical protein
LPSPACIDPAPPRHPLLHHPQAAPYGYSFQYVDPYVKDGSGKELLPLLSPTTPLPTGTADKLIQAYNFRLCVTDNSTLRVPFAMPVGYDSTHWELLRRFWAGW